MTRLRTLYHLARADFYERIRRYSFLFVLATAVFAGYLFVPPADGGYRVLQVGIQRGVYNSPWIGLMFGLIATMHLPLLGFYLVKNAVRRDRETGVGQIIAATPIDKRIYIVGKWLSNLAVLVLVLGVMTVMAVVMQLVRAEDTTVNLWALVGPIWFMGLPVLMIAAAIAVSFECVSFLHGGLGNIAFFFLWLGTIGVVISSAVDEATGVAVATPDPFGYTRQLVDIQGQVLADDPDADVGTGLIIVGKDIEGTFVWDGIDWTLRVVIQRVLWGGLAVAVVVAAAVPFDRFDPARSKRRPEWSVSREGKDRIRRPLRRIGTVRKNGLLRGRSADTDETQMVMAARLTPLAGTPDRGRFFGVLMAELRLMLWRQSLMWYAGALGLMIACVVLPFSVVQRHVLLAVWLWPLLIWSQMGTRELQFSTEQMVFSTPHPMRRQLPATWLAGVILTVVVGSGALARFMLEGETASFLACIVGALFVPALALSLGVWVGNSRAFELVYLLLWYVGLINRVPVFDHTGATAEALTMGMPAVYLGITATLLMVALIGRWRQIQG
jgi:hypothetical protein